jgi:hypothetical protein
VLCCTDRYTITTAATTAATAATAAATELNSRRNSELDAARCRTHRVTSNITAPYVGQFAADHWLQYTAMVCTGPLCFCWLCYHGLSDTYQHTDLQEAQCVQTADAAAGNTLLQRLHHYSLRLHSTVTRACVQVLSVEITQMLSKAVLRVYVQVLLVEVTQPEMQTLQS